MRSGAGGRLDDLVRNEKVDSLRQVLEAHGPAATRWANEDRQTLLFAGVARKENAREVCELLISTYGIDPAQKDKRGQTALHYLAKTAHADCVELLVARGCSVDHIDRLLRQTPLFYAARYGTARMVKKLLDMKADVNFKDCRGQTPLFWAESLEVCEKLLHARGDGCVAVDANGLTVVESHRQRHQHEISDFLAACAEVRGQRGRMTWSVQRSAAIPDGASAEAQGASGRAAGTRQGYASYATSLARQRDVDTLCLLEDEFVDDHRQMLGADLPEEELFNQIGLNPNSVTRRNTIRSIAQPMTRTGRVRHYTLKALFMPPNLTGQGGAGRTRAYQVVGYVYFRIVDGDREPVGSDAGSGGAGGAGARPGGASSAEVTTSTSASDTSGTAMRANRGHIVVSHLKVDRQHQRRGVATLLLAGMLQLAETERKGFVVSHLYLSVITRNPSATALYRRLGFVQTSCDGELVEWLHMRLALAHGTEAGAPSSGALRAEWLERVVGVCGSISHEISPLSRKRLPLQEALALDSLAGGLPQDTGRPSKRRLEPRCSSPSRGSAVSAITTSTSAGTTSAATSSGTSVATMLTYAKLSY